MMHILAFLDLWYQIPAGVLLVLVCIGWYNYRKKQR